MQIKIKEIEIHYIQYGNPKGKDIILLHGWGQNIEMMKILGDHFISEYRIRIPFFPVFGEIM